ncbi:MAG: AI-2E family transporter [Evtepia sp.]|uniref:AI-2E family transporter n=1 Tax=Evtepia sp. TaxID=2773933 RepID=UPI002A75F001|nr:AI-2E family transporter [Evtepia sp.]MDY3014550.1 AI-2E family transporter [Evtepia sp.]
MYLNKQTMKRLLLLITFTLLLYWALSHPDYARKVFSGILSALLPFLLGGCIAFFINVILRPLERLWKRVWGKRYGPTQEKFKRLVCLLLSTVIVILAFFALIFIVGPSLQESVANFASMLPLYVSQLNQWWQEISAFLAQHSIMVPELQMDPEAIRNSLENFFTNHGEEFLNTTIGITTSLFSMGVTLVLAFVFSLYVLAQKETLAKQAQQVLRALFSEKRANWFMDVANLTNKTFSHFVAGQLTEAVILGSLCFVGMVLFRMPYASVIAVLVGFTALIPIFGAFIGAAIGAFLILLINPIQAFWFLIFIVVLQQLEGNLIYPKVVGKSVGLPGIWVLVAVTLGGNAFGLLGMILSVPICSVLYSLGKQGVRNRLQKKEQGK